MDQSIDTRPTFIYALIDPRSNRIRYIGKTYKSLEKRLRQHLKDSYSDKESNQGKRDWILSLKRIQLVPKIKLIEVVPPETNWQEREKFWIAYYGEFCDLLNKNSGGGGARFPTTRVSSSEKLECKVAIYSPDGKLVRVLDTIGEASVFFDVSIQRIRQIEKLNESPFLYKDFFLFFGDNYPLSVKPDRNYLMRLVPVMKENDLGEFVEGFHSITEASFSVKIKTDNLLDFILEGKPDGDGYFWRFAQGELKLIYPTGSIFGKLVPVEAK